MYSLANNVLAQLKYDITGAALSLTVQPLAGVPPFNFPPAPTDVTAVPATYGTPYGILTLIDRLDPTAAKIEHILYSQRTAGVGADAGCYVYTVPAGGRGVEGSGAKAWTGGATYVLQQPTQDVLAMNTALTTLRGMHNMAHGRDALLKWDGTNFIFTKFRLISIGNGKHFSSTGYFEIAMPANGTTVKGFGGAPDVAVAGGAIPIAADTVLWYELPIGQTEATVAGNFHVSLYTAAFAVPAHWVMIASNMNVGGVGDKCLRVANGATLFPWIPVLGGVGFVNAWGNLGAGFSTAAYRKDERGIVMLKGVVAGGAAGNTIFTLPAGFRPVEITLRGTVANGAFGHVQITPAGLVQHQSGSTVYISLDGISFLAEN